MKKLTSSEYYRTVPKILNVVIINWKINWNEIAWSSCVLLIRVLLKVKLSLPTNVWKFWAQLRFKSVNNKFSVFLFGLFSCYVGSCFLVIWPFFRELGLIKYTRQIFHKTFFTDQYFTFFVKTRNWGEIQESELSSLDSSYTHPRVEHGWTHIRRHQVWCVCDTYYLGRCS